VHLARSGHGGLFLDPHADAIAEIKTYLTDPGVRERLVEGRRSAARASGVAKQTVEVEQQVKLGGGSVARPALGEGATAARRRYLLRAAWPDRRS